jgi:hypothetical protein
MAFRQKVAAQAIGDLAGIHPIGLLFRRGDPPMRAGLELRLSRPVK